MSRACRDAGRIPADTALLQADTFNVQRSASLPLSSNHLNMIAIEALELSRLNSGLPPLHLKGISAPSRPPLQRRRGSTGKRAHKPDADQENVGEAAKPAPRSASDNRWPVITNLIRAHKAAPSPPDSTPSRADSAKCTPVKKSGKRSALLPRKRPRNLHAASPKNSSLLSGTARCKVETPPRLRYVHHGHTRSSLHHQRELWEKRRREWDQHQCAVDGWRAVLEAEVAYGGILEDIHATELPPHLAAGPPRRPRADSRLQGNAEYFDRDAATPRNQAIYPRLGELASIRDAFLTSVDCWFGDFPLWTLAKLAWMYDLSHRTASGCGPPQAPGERHSEGSRLPAQAFDKSCAASGRDLVDSTTLSGDLTLVSGSTAEENTDAPLRSLSTSKTLSLTDLIAKASSSSSTPNASCSGNALSIPRVDLIRAWETCWFARWEILYHQVTLAAELAYSGQSGDEDPACDRSLDPVKLPAITRVIFSSSAVLFDPLRADADRAASGPPEPPVDDIVIADETDDVRAQSRLVVIQDVDDDDDDEYGEVIEGSKYRMGASVDPFSMFATAAVKDAETIDRFEASTVS